MPYFSEDVPFGHDGEHEGVLAVGEGAMLLWHLPGPVLLYQIEVVQGIVVKFGVR